MIEEKKRRTITLCYKPCTKGENKNSCPLNIKRPLYTQKFLSYSCLQIAFFPKCQSPAKKSSK